MAIIDKFSRSCRLDARIVSECFLRINTVTQRLMAIIIKGDTDRQVDIEVTEITRGRRKHVRIHPKKRTGDTIYRLPAGIVYIEDDVTPALPTIKVTWRRLERNK